jgi:aryl-alcohol dehydrogenase-like predicted oxidoreductase
MLLGGSKVEQLQANIAAVAKGPLPEDVSAACDTVGAGLRGPMPAYNR